jgi:hypothetical protein
MSARVPGGIRGVTLEVTHMNNIGIVVLWSLVLVAGVLSGGSIYETVVLNPLWAGAPPTSVTSWPYGAVQARFFQVATPAWALLSVAAFAASFVMPRPARPWARVAGVIGAAVMIWTAVYFIPRVVATEGNRGAGLTPEQITRMTLEFVRWGYLRTALLFSAWVMALRALLLASRG